MARGQLLRVLSEIQAKRSPAVGLGSPSGKEDSYPLLSQTITIMLRVTRAISLCVPQTDTACIGLLRKRGCRREWQGWHLNYYMAYILGTGQAVNVNGFILLAMMNEDWKDGSVGRALAVEFDNLSLVPGTHLVGEKELQTVL